MGAFYRSFFDDALTPPDPLQRLLSTSTAPFYMSTGQRRIVQYRAVVLEHETEGRP